MPGVGNVRTTAAPVPSSNAPSLSKSHLNSVKPPAPSGWNEVEVNVVACPAWATPVLNDARGKRAITQSFSVGPPTRLYTPGKPVFAHPMPHDVMPTRTKPPADGT